ncbi:Ankyrin repeat-containing protein At2g01680 [Linum perenne]
MEIHLAKADASALYDAAMTGNTEILHGLFQRDSLILKRFTLSSFSETPLHISVLAGHLDFTRELLRMNPGMATEVDSSNATPLHLASAPGHTEIVKALLNADSDACLVRDEDCRIPLHLAVIRGRVRIIQELVLARPESVLVKLDGDTVLHLCLRYNHLEALELLVQLINGDKSPSSSIICLGDQDRNTVLHLTVMLKQLQTTSYLVSLNSMGLLSVNCLNGHGSTALDCLELCPKDYKSLQIRDLLVVAGGRQVGAASSRLPLPPSSSLPSNNEASKTTTKCCNSICRKLKNLFAQDKNWVEERRETMLLVATILASMSFQSVINPPGGVWDDDNKDSTGCNTTNVCLAGTAILESRDPGSYGFLCK